jgi:hypothetical protein
VAEPARNGKVASPRLRWVARGLFAAAIASVAVVWWTGRGRQSRAAPPPPPVDWSREPWQTWRSARYGLSLERPAAWAPDEPFERFTERALADLRVAPIAGFRGETPVVIYRYTAPGPLTWGAWRRRLAQDGAFRAEFGSRLLDERPSRVSGRPGLDLLGEGATGRRLWRYRTLFFADGPVAFRVTAGADLRGWPAAAPIFDRLLRSIEYHPPAAPVTPEVG